ncbi:MAG TPA: PAS domain S-box protein [Anaerolineae bacterium]|nr:PAS domain S-box protein [Anaerolineae bacterium]HQI84148.1 PAS domain S-box protein [Anaerolineae bacterium]
MAIPKTLTECQDDLATMQARTASLAQATAELQAEISRCKHVEVELRHSEARFRTLFTNSPDATFVINLEGVILDVNDAACRLYQIEREALLGHNIVALTQPQWREEVAQAFAKMLNGAVEHLEIESVSQDMRVIPLEVKFSRIDYAGQPALLVNIRDITKRRQAEEVLKQRNRDLSLLNQAGQVFSSSLDLDAVLSAILDQVRLIMGVRAASIWLVEDKTRDIVCRESSEQWLIRGRRVAWGQGIVGWTVKEGQSTIVPDTRLNERHYKAIDLEIGVEIRCILSVPLKIKQNVIGALQVVDTEVDCFHQEDIPIMEALAATAAIAIENARLFEQVLRDAETKTTLIQEINHRVKNNLSAIIGLLYSEQRYLSAGCEANGQTLIQGLIGRVQGMAQVHAMLSDAEWAPLPLDTLTHRIINAALQTLPRGVNIAVDVMPSPVRVPSSQATNLALIINELTTNTIKYALKDRSTAKIRVRITEEENEVVVIEFYNDGPDYPTDVVDLTRHNLGLYLIKNLVERGLSGALTLHNDNGPVTTIRFRNNKT